MNGSITAAPLTAVFAALGLGCGAVPAQPASEAPAATATPPVNAVWVERKQSFTYFGDTTYYSCDGLRDKVRYILKQLGARDLEVSSSCVEMGGYGVEAMPGVRIKAYFAREATPELLQQIADGAAERELIARVRGRGDAADDAAAQFPAAWQRVELEGVRHGRIANGDCELLQQLARQVLEPAGIRVLRQDSQLGCVRHGVPIRAVRLVLETLQPLPPPDESPTTPEPTPAAGESSPATTDS
ncbi:MAG TPA: hypothetical protein VD737_10805 [Steroidobacteraceae bacterium]|nr:hypothetical protein [Steroidobacteraceae bacterium]